MALSAATWQPVDAVGLNQPIDETSTTQKHQVGMRVRCIDTSSNQRGYAEFEYHRGVASVAAADACILSRGDAAIRTVAREKGPVGIAMAAIVADNYGWFQVKGRAIVNVAAAFADNTVVYLTGTAGTLDDAVVAGDIVYGARGASAIDTGQALIDLVYPHCADTDNA
jgi:hypothetical protein